MSEKRETHARLVEILRRGIIDTINRYPNDLPDGLEAAHERELSKRRPKTGGDFGQFGDAAKLLEAVIALIPVAEHGLSARTHSLNCTVGETNIEAASALVKQAKEAITKARAALAKPQRNCERFATADDARREFNYLWNFVWQRGGGCVAERNYEEEFDAWLFAPAEEGGAK